MSDMVRSLDNVIICIEPGNHEESVSPRVANYIGQLQRENAQLRKYVARLAEANGAAAVAKERVGERVDQEVLLGESSE